MRILDFLKSENDSAASFNSRAAVFICAVLIAFSFAGNSFAQTKPKTPAKTTQPPANLPKVVQIDDAKFKELIKANGKPLLINFWATWCVPCREEFPDLVKIDAAYRGKIDFFTVSLDFVEEINRDVPKFLSEMKAEMPSYLLVSEDESTLISSIAKDWSGGLPFTILYNEKGEIAYFKQGKFKPDVLRAEIDKALSVQKQISQMQIVELPSNSFFSEYSYEKGKEEAQKDVADGKFIVRRYGLTPGIAAESLAELKRKYGIEIVEHGCMANDKLVEYVKGYNEVSTAEIKRRFGLDF